MDKRSMELRNIALKYIESHNTMTIATCADNVPWAAHVFYVSEEFTLYFISNPISAIHCRNITLNPLVSVAISEDYKLKWINDWKKIKGIQMEGFAEMLTEKKDIERASKLYMRKYPFTSFYLKRLFDLGEYTLTERFFLKLKLVPSFSASSNNRFFRVKPKRVFLVDNERSFEKRLEIQI
jgi:uncharacterized protein YhbP (UPF0306 family)